jgi:hypothetical protein
MADAVGPVWAGGFEETVGEGQSGLYTILWLPDKHNDDLQKEGKPPVYYWMPNTVRIARDASTGDFKFHLIHFEGVLNPQSSIDATPTADGTPTQISGGVLTVSTTAAPPDDVLQSSQNQLIERFRGKDKKYWGWTSPVTPEFRPMEISANVTSLTNLSPTTAGTVPNSGGSAATGAAGGKGGAPPPTGGGGKPAGGVAAGGGAAPAGGDGSAGADGTATGTRSLRSIRSLPSAPVLSSPRTVTYNPVKFRGPSNLDMWYWNLQGQGPGNLDLLGENAFSGLVGSLPAALLWSGFKGAYSPIVVRQDIKFGVWSELIRLKLTGDWKRIFDGFSAELKGHYLFFSADIKVAYKKLVVDGTIKVELEIDTTIPGADQMAKEVEKREDLILQKFMEQAQELIFKPVPPDDPAKASDGPPGSPWGVGFAMNYEHQETTLKLQYDETIDERFLMQSVVSGALEGFYNEIKKDPKAKDKYFTTLYLDDWDRKVSRVFKAVCNWPSPGKAWVGEPVAFMSAQVGYPSADDGSIEWNGNIFQQTDPPGSHWEIAVARKNLEDVTDPPAGWTPDKTLIKRQLHMLEPASDADSPYAHVQVEKDPIDLDGTDPNGQMLDDLNLAVRANIAGVLAVGPVRLNKHLTDSNQLVEVTFQALGQDDNGNDRPPSTFLWTQADQTTDRWFMVYTGQPKFFPTYRYQVHAYVQGGLMSDGGLDWMGPWVQVSGNGPCIVKVPAPNSKGVSSKSFIPGTVKAGQPAAPPPNGAGAGPPPASGDQGAPPATGAGAPPPSKRSVVGTPVNSGAAYSDKEPAVSGWRVK